MLDICVLTLFPSMFEGVFGESILKRAVHQGSAQLRTVNFRDYATDKHHTVDDYPFGGGAGMLLKAEPLFRAVDAVRLGTEAVPDVNSPLQPFEERIILMSPQGRVFTQAVAEEFSRAQRLIILCGHYEGFDDRVRQHLVTDEISVGDYVLTGGEIAAMAIIDATVRLLPDVLGNGDSLIAESHTGGLLEYPQYTRPATFRDWEVPPTLLSGNHAEIEKWKKRHALYRTWRQRPDLLEGRLMLPVEQEQVIRWQNGDFSDIDVQI
jgi:tRNA (guanine37-N1)-methyltransferase